MDKNIKFGFWNYAPFGIISNQDAVKDWVEVGSNLPMSFIYDSKKDKPSSMIELLDECEKNNLKLIISDTRTLFTNLRSLSIDEFRKQVKEAYKDFGKHKATFGFFLGDEPSPDETDLFIDAAKIVLEEMPNLTPFGNLLPYFGCGDAVLDIGNKNFEFYYKLLQRILKETKLPVIGYDQYTQCLDEVSNQEAGINSYFIGLDKYFENCKQNNVPFLMSLLSVGHWNYRVPTEDDIRWQISTAFAHGARGVIWFYFYQNDKDYSYRLSPFTNYELKKTPMFDIIAREQYLFKKTFEEQFNKMELTAVYHLGHLYDEEKRFVYDEHIKEILTDRKFPVIISYYKEFNSEKKWVSFVNGSQKYSNLFRITFTDGRKEVFWLAPGEMRLFELK